MPDRSPLDVLSDIVDEVDGFRNTDRRSFLPPSLVRAARELVDETPSVGDGKLLGSSEELAGRTVQKVFSSPKRGSMLIFCTDGCFLVLAAENDGESAYVHEYSSFGASGLADFLEPADLFEIGLMTSAQRFEAERQQKLEKAKARADRLAWQMAQAKAELDRLTAA